MIQTKEEIFIAELGGNPQQEIELSYGAKIKITDLLSKYLEAINDTHCCETLKDKYTMPFDVWYDKNVVESKDGKYFVDGERLRFYELISKHKTECLLDL